MKLIQKPVFASQDLSKKHLKVKAKEILAVLANSNIKFLTLELIRKEEAIKDKKELILVTQDFCGNGKNNFKML